MGIGSERVGIGSGSDRDRISSASGSDKDRIGSGAGRDLGPPAGFIERLIHSKNFGRGTGSVFFFKRGPKTG